MKHIKQNSIILDIMLILLLIITSLTSCSKSKENEDIKPKTQQLTNQEIKGHWAIKGDNLSIYIIDDNYTTTNATTYIQVNYKYTWDYTTLTLNAREKYNMQTGVTTQITGNYTYTPSMYGDSMYLDGNIYYKR